MEKISKKDLRRGWILTVLSSQQELCDRLPNRWGCRIFRGEIFCCCWKEQPRILKKATEEEHSLQGRRDGGWNNRKLWQGQAEGD